MAGTSFGVAPELAVGQLAQSFRADLRGFNEVPSISTSGTGRFDAVLIPESGSIEYTLRYSGLESAVTLAHIHFSQAATNGGIVVFLCTNLGDGPAGTQACPAGDGEISGVITAAEVLGPADQGLIPRYSISCCKPCSIGPPMSTCTPRCT